LYCGALSAALLLFQLTLFQLTEFQLTLFQLTEFQLTLFQLTEFQLTLLQVTGCAPDQSKRLAVTPVLALLVVAALVAA
jgi:hypothetical protein